MTERINHEELVTLITESHEAIEEKFKAMKTENDEVKSSLKEIEQRMVRRPGAAGGEDEQKSWGEIVAASEELKTFKQNNMRGTIHLQVKTVNTIAYTGAAAAGALTAPHIVTDPVLLGRRPFSLRSVIPTTPTGAGSVWFARQTARQMNASAVAELAQKPFSDGTFAQVQVTIPTIAHMINVSKQIFEDSASLRSTINSELTYGVDLAEETEMLMGDGTGAHMLGIIPQATAYSAAFAITGETAIDRIGLAILQSELAFLPANAVVLNPTDVMKLALLKNAQGEYIMGDPARANTNPTIWGRPIVKSFGITAGNFLTGAFGYGSEIFDRAETEILISSENQNNFELNKLTVRGERRTVCIVKAPAAFVAGTLP